MGATLSLGVLLAAAVPQDDETLHLDLAPPEFIRRWNAAERARDMGLILELYLHALDRLNHRLWSADHRRWIPLPRHLQSRLAAMPATILAPHETLAREMLGACGDRDSLRKTAGRFLHTRPGRDAMAALANEAFDEGRVEEAVRGWIRLMEARPSADLEAKAAHGMATLGEIPLVEPADQDAEIVAGGRRVTLREYLRSLAPAPGPAREPPSPHAAAPRGGFPHEVLLGTYDLRLDGGAFARSQAVSIPAYADLGDRELVVITNGIRVVAIDPSGGDGGSLEDHVVWRFPASEDPIRELPTAYDSPRSPQPLLGATVAGDRIYATMFSRHRRSRLHGRRPDRFDGPAAIRALDLNSGRLIWDTDDLKADVEGETLPALDALRFGQKNFCFAGPPLVRGSRLLAAVMTTPNSERECHVLCLGAEDGRVMWSTSVASAYRHGSPPLVPCFIEEAGRIYIQTGFGIVASLETETGEIEWLAGYRPSGGRFAAGPPVISGGRVIFLPQDRYDPVAVDRRTGREAPLPPLSSQVAWWRIHYLERAGGTWLAAIGSQSFAVNTADGKVIDLSGGEAARPWRCGLEAGRLYVPMPGFLATYDTDTWKLLDRSPWPFEGDAGNMVLAGGLCLAMSDRLAVTAGSTELRERFRAWTETSPPRADACLRAAAILERSGRPLEAETYYRRALSVLEGDPARAEEVEAIRRKLPEGGSQKPDRP